MKSTKESLSLTFDHAVAPYGSDGWIEWFLDKYSRRDYQEHKKLTDSIDDVRKSNAEIMIYRQKLKAWHDARGDPQFGKEQLTYYTTVCELREKDAVDAVERQIKSAGSFAVTFCDVLIVEAKREAEAQGIQINIDYPADGRQLAV